MILNGKTPYNKIKEALPNAKIWRYMDFPKFIQLITTSRLFFVRLDKLTDQLEGTLTPNNLVEIYNRFHNADITMSVREATLRRNKEVKNIENFKKYTDLPQ